MRLVLVSKLCLACTASTELEQKLHFQYLIEQVRHNLVVEAQEEACECSCDGGDECSCEYEALGDMLIELELACSNCIGNEGLVSVIIRRWLDEEKKHRENVEAEAQELMMAKANGTRPKVARLDVRR